METRTGCRHSRRNGIVTSYTEENGWQRSTYAYDAIGQLIGTEEVELASLPAVESPVYNITLDANGGTVTMRLSN